MKIDQTDLEILANLRDDARITYRELGEKINSNINTVANRIKRLEKNKFILGYNTHIDYSAIGYKSTALVKMNLKNTNLLNSNDLASITSMPSVEVVYSLTGPYNICSLIKAKDFRDLVEKIGIIRSNENVAAVDSEYIIKKYKFFEDFNPLSENPKPPNPINPRKKKLDELDFAILRELRCGANKPLRELSAKLKYPISTIKERTDKMVTSGIIKRFVANVDFFKLGYWGFQAVGIKLNSANINDKQIPAQLSKIKETSMLCQVLGKFDFYAALLVKDTDHAMSLVKQISSIPGVRAVEPHLGLSMLKSRMQFNPLSEFRMKAEKK
jgi:Lrp/AsnC family leucine-responsive transcriptional regulator